MYFFRTRIGVFSIVHNAGRWHVLCGDESLGAYKSPQVAAEEVASGVTFWPSCGVNPASLGIPDDLSDWSSDR